MANFYVYEHWRLDRNECFYVGKGSGDRAYRRIGRNQHWVNIVAKLKRAGSTYEVKIVASNLTESEAFAVEKQRIAFWRDISDLANKTDGGEGRSGLPHTAETKDKIAKSHKGKKLSKEHREKMSEARRGQKLTEEHRKNIADSLKGHTTSEDTRTKIAIANKGKKRSNEVRSRLSAMRMGQNNPSFGKKRTAETRAKLSEAAKRQHARAKGLVQ